jgi:aminoglycoside/choline kinase family phosphotransferase
MAGHKEKNHSEIIEYLLEKSGFGPLETVPEIERLSGDGSDRLFFRLKSPSLPPLLVILASSSFEKGRIEARSSFRIGTHLFDKGVPVPEIFGYDSRNGALVCSDLGDTHLQKTIQSQEGFSRAKKFYFQAIDALVKLQLVGRRDFDVRFCWDTPRYDRMLMLERESGYFADSFCKDFMGRIPDDPQLNIEFQKIAYRASQEPADYLLHRDFQSRNLMVCDEKVYIIDFQGARLGPLAYDLASLLIDPYAGLTESQKEVLYLYYVDNVSQYIDLNPDQFYEGYCYLALQRNMQILGAFAFLSQIKGKDFFKQYISPAVQTLSGLLSQFPGKAFPSLSCLVEQIIEQLKTEELYQLDMI